jgi:hypothetical protein
LEACKIFALVRFNPNTLRPLQVQTLYQKNRETYERLIASKDEQIALLKGLLGKSG